MRSQTLKLAAGVQGNGTPALSRKNALPVFDVLDTNMVPHDEGPREPRCRFHVGIWYILRAQRGYHIPTLRPKYIPYSYIDPLGQMEIGVSGLGSRVPS